MQSKASEGNIFVQPLTEYDFDPYGNIIGIGFGDRCLINQGRCSRFHNQARIEAFDGQAGISIFHSDLCVLPYRIELMERHPLSSQTFIPMSMDVFVIIVAADNDGKPSQPIAFISFAGQGIHYYPNVWHGVLTPLSGNGLFAVVDYVGDVHNLEEYRYDTPYVIRPPMNENNNRFRRKIL